MVGLVLQDASGLALPLSPASVTMPPPLSSPLPPPLSSPRRGCAVVVAGRLRARIVAVAVVVADDRGARVVEADRAGVVVAAEAVVAAGRGIFARARADGERPRRCRCCCRRRARRRLMPKARRRELPITVPRESFMTGRVPRRLRRMEGRSGRFSLLLPARHRTTRPRSVVHLSMPAFSQPQRQIPHSAIAGAADRSDSSAGRVAMRGRSRAHICLFDPFIICSFEHWQTPEPLVVRRDRVLGLAARAVGGRAARRLGAGAADRSGHAEARVGASRRPGGSASWRTAGCLRRRRIRSRRRSIRPRRHARGPWRRRSRCHRRHRRHHASMRLG